MKAFSARALFSSPLCLSGCSSKHLRRYACIQPVHQTSADTNRNRREGCRLFSRVLQCLGQTFLRTAGAAFRGTPRRSWGACASMLRTIRSGTRSRSGTTNPNAPRCLRRGIRVMDGNALRSAIAGANATLCASALRNFGAISPSGAGAWLAEMCT